MKNREAKKNIAECLKELEGIKSLVAGLGEAALPTAYMKKYAVIRATGSIEYSFKTIIADKIDCNSHSQVKNFIKKKIRDSSANPKLGNIENMLSEFDDKWRKKFDELMALGDKARLKLALSNLCDARNEFAHGGHPSVEIDTTLLYFKDGTQVLEILDSVVNYNYDDI